MSLTNHRIAAVFTGLTLGLVACSDQQPTSNDDASTGGVPNGGTAGAPTGGSAMGGTTGGVATGGSMTGGIGPGGAPTGGSAGAPTGGSAPGGASGAAGAPGGSGGNAGAGAPGGAGGAAGVGMSGSGAGGTAAGGGGAGAGGKGGSGGSGGTPTGCGGTLSGFGGTASRPTLTSTQAACHTILTYLAKTGSVTAPTTDNWNPTAGVGDVATFTANFTVAASGGTHTTVQAAVTAAVSMGGTNRIYIRVMPGTYREVVCVPTGAPPITLYSTNADASQTTIVYNNLAGTTVGTRPTNACSNPSGDTYGTSGSATFAAFGPGFMAKNLTFSNDGDEASISSGMQAVALSTRNDKLVFENVRLLGNQDTLLVGTNNVTNIMRAYFKNAYIEGDVDFICGRATAVFDGGTIRLVTNRRNNGNALAPSTDSRNPYGFLVIGATLNAASGATAGGMTLGRAWDESQVDVATYTANVQSGTYPNGQAVVRDSTLGAHVNGTSPWASAATTSRAFSSTPTATLPANRLWESGNTGP